MEPHLWNRFIPNLLRTVFLILYSAWPSSGGGGGEKLVENVI